MIKERRWREKDVRNATEQFVTEDESILDRGSRTAKNKGRITSAWRRTTCFCRGHGPPRVKGFCLEAVVLLLSAETPKLTWLLFPPLCSPSSQPQCLEALRMESGAEAWQWPAAAGHTLEPGQTGLRKRLFNSRTDSPINQNGHGRKNLSQSATGLDIGTILSLASAGSMPGFLPTAYST